MKMKIGYGIWNMGYGRKAAYILSAIFYILNALAFATPFGSWIDVKTECGAVGDGVSDDTAAIQKGLDMAYSDNSKKRVLFFPAGTYRTTSVLTVLRKQGGESLGIGIQGEGMERTKIVYDGKGGEPILMWGAGYSTIRGMGFQAAKEGDRRSEIGDRGADKPTATNNTISNIPSTQSQAPTAGISMGPVFSTSTEIADCGFENLPIGILGGQDKMQGQAEVCVRRCRWQRCGQGILLQNWNSLDWWVWDSVFEECGQAISNSPGCGNYNAYRNLFLGSKDTDLRIDNLGGFGFVGNVSKGSGMFLNSGCHTAGANIVLQGNRVYRDGWDSKRRDSAIIYIGHPGPVLLLDNALQRPLGAPGPEMFLGPGNHMDPSGSALLMGNTTTVSSNSLVKKGAFDIRLIDEGDSGEGLRVAEMPDEGEDRRARLEPKLSFPAQVVEVGSGANAEELQRVIDAAPDGAVVHLPSGKYSLSHSVVIRMGKKIKIQGDGVLFSTCLQAAGDFEGDALVICQPTDGLVLEDLQIGSVAPGGGPAGLLIQVKDEPGVAVHGDQIQSYGFGPGLVVQGLDEARVLLENHGHNGVTVFGGTKSKRGNRGGATVEILQGASSRNKGLRPETPIYDVRQGARLMVRDIWYEGDPKEYVKLSDSGDFVQCGHKIAPNKDAGHTGVESIKLAGKSGQVLMAQSALCGADLVIGKMEPGFQVTLFGLTPNPGTRISIADPSSERSETTNRISETNNTKSTTLSNAASSMPPKSAEPGLMQLMCRQNNVKLTGSEALPDVNADGDISSRFQILREWKLPDPDLPAKVRLHRVRCMGGVGMVVVSLKPKADKK
jgi:hypothetical protein